MISSTRRSFSSVFWTNRWLKIVFRDRLARWSVQQSPPGMPGRRPHLIGAVTLPHRPTTLGEARGGLEMLGDDEPTSRWLRAWAESPETERDILLRLPGGWFELTHATIAPILGAPVTSPQPGPEPARYMVRFDRRCAAEAPG
jgi:hypothetical protein